jgi:TraM recognition site of TraD and TraG
VLVQQLALVRLELPNIEGHAAGARRELLCLHDEDVVIARWSAAIMDDEVGKDGAPLVRHTAQSAAVVHGEAQLAERWGDHGRQIVLDTSSVKVFLPGITDTTTLPAASTLCGQASWKIWS